MLDKDRSIPELFREVRTALAANDLAAIAMLVDQLESEIPQISIDARQDAPGILDECRESYVRHVRMPEITIRWRGSVVRLRSPIVIESYQADD